MYIISSTNGHILVTESTLPITSNIVFMSPIQLFYMQILDNIVYVGRNTSGALSPSTSILGLGSISNIRGANDETFITYNSLYNYVMSLYSKYNMFKVKETEVLEPLVGYFISPSGSDSSGDGTEANPWFSLNKAWNYITPGSTIYLRGGDYRFNESQYLVGKNGTPGNLIKIFNYPNEKPNITRSSIFTENSNGVHFTGNYFYWKGIEISGFDQVTNDNDWRWAMKIINSNYNIFELLNIHHNACGCQIVNSGYSEHCTGNLIKNCDFHNNQDPLTNYENGDGLDFGSITHPEDSNRIIGCRFWNNSDDGVDFFDNDSFMTIENCWSWSNGYIPGTRTPAGNGMGFKLGDSLTDQRTIHKRTVRNCVSVDNRTNGFTTNSLLGIIKMYNCTAYLNGNIGIHLADSNLNHEIYNCISYGNTTNYDLSANGTKLKNSGLDSPSATNGDFINLNISQLSSARKADGSLPDITALHLNSNSSLVNAGTDVGIPYLGILPDLGAFETI